MQPLSFLTILLCFYGHLFVSFLKLLLLIFSLKQSFLFMLLSIFAPSHTLRGISPFP